MAQYAYDVAVIGGGPGGYVAAIKAAQRGKRTCLIESTHLGGVCLNEGCIPTKTLIRTSSLLHEIKESHKYAIQGVEADKVRVSMPELQKRRQAVVNQLVGGVGGLLRGNKVTVIDAKACFVDPHTVRAGDKQVTAEHFIIATGSLPLMPSFIAREGKTNIITSTEALLLDHIPESVAIIGGGVIGVEFAYLLRGLGSRVTVLELMDHILPMVDEEVSAMAQKRLEKDGVVFHLGAKVRKVQDNAVVYEKDGAASQVEAEVVLMAVGRTPNTEGLGAEKIGIAFEKNAIKTDAYLRTSLPNIYAIGDVGGKVMLAHTASHEGVLAVENICGGSAAMRYDRIPSCIYLEPEIASIGLTEQQARERAGEIRVGKFPMAANGKSLVAGESGGIAKVILDARLGEILGVHLYCGHATEMISEIAVAMESEATADEVIHTIHPHPTVSEAIPEAFMAAVGKAVHFL